MKVFEGLEPKAVWEYFEEICQVPRPSKKEEQIIEYLLEFGKKHNLETKRDEIGNVVICKPATEGKENVKTVILQSHMDMVCEKNSNTVHDFEKDAIQPYIDGNWVKAKGTTLGADDGIGMATQMAILTATDIEHGAIECLFTVDEETGLSGAFALKNDFLKGEVLLNLDSEDEGEVFIGCAGGIDTVSTFKYSRKKVAKKTNSYKISVSGLNGGHSGDDINKGYGNSNKIINRFLWTINQKFEVRLSEFNGGNLRNAIPREAYATVVVEKKNKKKFEDAFKKFAKEVTNELSVTEPNVKFDCESIDKVKFVINRKTQANLLNALYACPHGVFAMSYRMPGMVETSTNLASVKYKSKNQIEITTSQRSDLTSSKIDLSSMVRSVFTLAGAEVRHTDGYPGWAPNPKSELVKISKESYKRLFGKEPIVRSIHAGLECGLFLEKYPKMDMISFGPTLRAVHSPDERLDIETVKKFWDYLLDILVNIPVEEK